jgi:fatty-acyl-CoA synthase
MPAIPPDDLGAALAGQVVYKREARLQEIQESARDAWIRALEMTANIARHPATTLPILVEELADKFEIAPALISERQTLSYRALADRANYYALWALRQNLAFGDVFCLLMQNSPEYFAIWLGITKVGGIVSLINTRLTASSLAHSIKTVAPKHVIADTELAERVTLILPQLPSSLKLWVHRGNAERFCTLEDKAGSCADRPHLSLAAQSPTLKDRALYIYTSGTTGLPKAAVVSHFRLMQWSYWFAGMMDTHPEDRMYNCLPMYHGVGGVIAIGAVLVSGGSVTLRESFSARSFWNDVVEWNCTLFQYIGELCRYLVNSPPHPREIDHRLRLCCGNGLSAGVWEKFKQRFHIPRILEFYGATEGTFSLYNCEGKPGAVGRIPPYLAHRFPMTLVKFDYDSCMPQRDENGFCVGCTSDEIGEAIGRIVVNRSSAAGQFEGYSDPVASEEKLLRNVFVTGDVWFRTGDLMRRDKDGYFYFIDRVGDTFRWKGENVSTTELTDIICEYSGVTHAVVYGVAVPGAEGRAGMVTLVVNDGFEVEAFRRYLVERLPEYARPLFLRLASFLQATPTFKSRKGQLALLGFDPSATTDPIYFNDRAGQAFVRIDSGLHGRILSGQVRI